MVAIISSSAGHETKTDVSSRQLTTKERARNALKALGICWGLSLASLPLPPVHWVSTPFFFFFGLYLSVRRWREETFTQAFSFTCPECQKTVEVPEHSKKNDWQLVCPHCRFPLRARIL